MLDQWTSGECPVIPGAAILVGKKEKVLEPRFFGFQNPGSSAERIRRDGIFLLASITKPIVYLSAMKLVEKGLLSLVDPVPITYPSSLRIIRQRPSFSIFLLIHLVFPTC